MASLLDFSALDLSAGSAEQNGGVPSVPTRQSSRTINGVTTNVLCQAFADRTFVLITQLARIGSMIQVSAPPSTLPPALLPPSSSSLFPNLPTPHPATVLTPVFGVAPSAHLKALYELYATMVGAIVFDPSGSGAEDNDGGLGEKKPVLMGIALKLPPPASSSGNPDEGDAEEDRKVFGEIMEMVKECKVW